MLPRFPIRKEHLEVERVDGATILTDLDGDYVHVVPDEAAFVLEQCDGRRNCDEIAQLLSQWSERSYESAAAEVAHIVGNFADFALVESARREEAAHTGSPICA